MLSTTLGIFTSVLLPILILVALGALVQRSHPLNIPTLSKLQIYLFVPIFLFVRVSESSLSWAAIAGIAGAILLAKAVMAAPLWVALHRLRVSPERLGVILLSSVIFNAGNFGIPVAERAYGAAGGAVQALIVMVSNLALWGIGYPILVASTGSGLRGAIVEYLKLPMVYLMVGAFAVRGLHIELHESIRFALRLIADGLVPIALVTLGAQLAQQARWPRWRVVLPVVALKLLALPVITAGVVLLFGLWPWPGAMLIVASAGPTAVNTLLLAIEQNSDPELAADCVFWTTLLSALTVTLVLAVVMGLGGRPPG